MGQAESEYARATDTIGGFMLAYEDTNGIVTSLSRDVHLSQQTMHGWREQTHAKEVGTDDVPAGARGMMLNCKFPTNLV